MNPQTQEERLDRFGEIINLDDTFFRNPQKDMQCRKVFFSHSLLGRMLLFYLGFAIDLDSISGQVKTHIKFGEAFGVSPSAAASNFETEILASTC